MEYDEQGHIKVTRHDYPKPMHDGAGKIVQALNADHETELRRQGFSHKVWDREVHSPAAIAARTAVPAPTPTPAPSEQPETDRPADGLADADDTSKVPA